MGKVKLKNHEVGEKWQICAVLGYLDLRFEKPMACDKNRSFTFDSPLF
jgi:hypothetical protein